MRKPKNMKKNNCMARVWALALCLLLGISSISVTTFAEPD